VETFIYLMGELGGASFGNYANVGNSRGILHLYASLSPLQPGQLHAGRPLAVRALLPPQQVLMLDLNRSQNRSMFGFLLGAKLPRRPQLLANAVLALEQRKGPLLPEGNSGIPLPGAGSSGPSYVFRLTFADGQADTYMVMTTAPGTQGAREVPSSTPARRP
jgi:hypothetical protein